jgi:hypothetical protein
MAADYEAGLALSSIAAPRAGDFAAHHKNMGRISGGSRKTDAIPLQSLEPISRISHLHITLVHCTRGFNQQPNAGQRHRTP